jgi:hypothetical protein
MELIDPVSGKVVWSDGAGLPMPPPPAGQPYIKRGVETKATPSAQRVGTFDQMLNGTGIPERAATMAELFSPVEAMRDAGAASQKMFDPNTSGWGRVGAFGEMTGNMASVLAPVVGAKLAGGGAEKVAKALTDSLSGVSLPDVDMGKFMADEFGGLKLYHGSPHDFDKFSLDKIGTGEGYQGYGRGLYFAENETVARSYRDKVGAMLGKGDPQVDGRKINWDDPIEGAAFEVMRHGGDREAAAEFAARTYRKGSPVAEIIRSGADLPEVKSPGKIYEVNVDADPKDFVDWDKPISQQPEKVRPVLDGWARALGLNPEEAHFNRLAGLTQTESGAKALRETGTPGIKYLDQGSRGTDGNPTSNYVVFDENLINIVKKYGVAGAAAMLGISQADIAQAMGQDETMGSVLGGK